MRSPVWAIAWEIWRKNRWGFRLVLGLLSSGLLVRLFGSHSDGMKTVAGLSMALSFLVTFAIFSYADLGSQISFPARTFTLPVRTGLLVHGPILFGVLGITILHGAWSVLFLLPLDAHYQVGLFAIYWVAALMTFQASIWCLADSPKSLVVVLLIALSLFIRLAVALAGDYEASRAVVCLLVFLAVAYLCARVGIKQQRCGQWRILSGAHTLIERVTGALLRRKRPFAAARQAQLWMEWRRNAATPLILLGAGLILACVGFGDFGRDGYGAFSAAWFYLFCVWLTLWAFISGLLIARDAAAGSLGFSSFLAVRPVTSGELAFAKIKLTGLVTLAGWLVYVAGLSLWFGHGWRADQPVLRQDGGLIPTLGFVTLALVWHLVGALPLWLAGRIESPAWAGLLLLGGYIALGNLVQFLDKHFDLLAVLPWLFTFALVAKILLALWFFGEANRRRLLTARTTRQYFLFWLLGTICFVAIACALCRRTVFPQPLVALGAALLLPLARVGLAPLALARARHR